MFAAANAQSVCTGMANKLLLLMVLFLGHVVALENSTVKRMTSMSQQLFAGTAGLLRGDPQHSSSRWKMVIFASLCASLPGIWFLRKRFRGKQSEEVRELMSGKPSLVNEDAGELYTAGLSIEQPEKRN